MTTWNKRNDRRACQTALEDVLAFAVSGPDLVCRSFDGDRYVLARDLLTAEAVTCIVRRHGQSKKSQLFVGSAQACKAA